MVLMRDKITWLNELTGGVMVQALKPGACVMYFRYKRRNLLCQKPGLDGEMTC